MKKLIHEQKKLIHEQNNDDKSERLIASVFLKRLARFGDVFTRSEFDFLSDFRDLHLMNYLMND